MATCYAVGCYSRILAERLMCPKHWLMLPHDLRTRIWKAYRPGQAITGQLSIEYVEASRVAINYIARLEMQSELTSAGALLKVFDERFDRELER